MKSEMSVMANHAARDILYKQLVENNSIDPKLYDKYVVKR